MLCSSAIYSLALSFSKFELFYILPVVFLMFLNKNYIFKILKKLLFLNLFIVILAIFLLYETNIYEALDLFLRVNFILFFNLLLYFSSNGFDIVRGFMILKFPKKFVSTLYFTVKLISELNKELKNIKISLKTRNFKPKTNIFTYKTYGNIFGILFLKTISKSDSLKECFVYRGFKDEIFLSYNNSYSKLDFILVFLLIFTLFLKVVL